jgi:hypothetical protein
MRSNAEKNKKALHQPTKAGQGRVDSKFCHWKQKKLLTNTEKPVK